MKLDWDLLKQKLTNEESFEMPYEAIKEICAKKRIPNEYVAFILALEDELLIADFLLNYAYFNQKQLNIIRKYIRKHIVTHPDECFRNDLITFACYWEITDFWDECLEMIENPNESHLVILSALSYIYERMQITDLPRVKEAFDKVLNEGNYYQNCQTVAAFYLFRLTLSQEYYEYLKESMPLNQGINRNVLKNLLEEEYNQTPYFAYYEEMSKWVSL